MKKLLTATLLCLFAFSATALFAKGQSEAATPQRPLIGISKFVTHPALDAVEKGIQDVL